MPWWEYTEAQKICIMEPGFMSKRMRNPVLMSMGAGGAGPLSIQPTRLFVSRTIVLCYDHNTLNQHLVVTL